MITGLPPSPPEDSGRDITRIRRRCGWPFTSPDSGQALSRNEYKRRLRSLCGSVSCLSITHWHLHPRIKMNSLKASFVISLVAAFAAAAPATITEVPPPSFSGVICPEYKIAFCPCGDELVFLPSYESLYVRQSLLTGIERKDEQKKAQLKSVTLKVKRELEQRPNKR